MSNTIPAWAQPALQKILSDAEPIEFTGTGRLDAVPPSGLMAVVYWLTYIGTNYVALCFTALFRNRAVVVITASGVIIISERSWRFPLWVIPFSQRLLVEHIHRADLTSISTVSAKFLWVLSANGLQLECESGTTRIINGLNDISLTQAQDLLR